MKLHFDPNQVFQLDAIDSVADVFDGQPQAALEFSVITTTSTDGLFSDLDRTELGVGNRLLLDDEVLRKNLRAIQRRNEIDVDETAPVDGWDLFDGPASQSRFCPHISVEMETGTGKTYVYLRTVFELSKRYGFTKFVIVVPSVPIREGVLKNIEITAAHFRSIYDNVPFDHFVYDARRVDRLRQFAVANTVQIAIINIDAFRKNFSGTEDERKSNVIYKESDRLSGHQPIEFIQAGRPVVIIDEPQSVDNTERAQDAIKALNPLCTLRYSATHRNPYNLVYRLDPVRAFELGLVKQIVVASASDIGFGTDAYIRVDAIDYKPSLRAKLRIHVQTSGGPKAKLVTVRNGHDLFAASNERTAYAQGFSVAEISAEPGSEFIRFTNGRKMRIGEESGSMRDELWRVQIRHTIKKHLDREVRLQELGIKVLSLFFIDRVANYRQYDPDGRAMPGRLASVFAQELGALANDERYRTLDWLRLPVERLHNGYFASDKRERFKDSNEGRDTEADDDIYALIMRDKEQLLSPQVPLRFIFTHSALREGWDNPNVFQICTLNEGRGTIRKRQEIGRGLRLPVDSEGRRVFDKTINTLWIMANESYEDFARALQTEYEDECGVIFGKVGLREIAKLTFVLDGEEQQLGDATARRVLDALVERGLLDTEGYISHLFEPRAKDFSLDLPDEFHDLEPTIVNLLSSYQLRKHIRRDRDEGVNPLRKDVVLGPEFHSLWERIKQKTTYRVEFGTDVLVKRSCEAVAKMHRIVPPVVRVTAGRVELKRAGVVASAFMATDEPVATLTRAVPDIIAYLQEQTELTRSTLVRILIGSGRLADFFIDPQRFMDAIAAILRHELYQLLISGIKYERIQGVGGDSEWEMLLFKDEELINHLSAQRVSKSVYEYIVYESEVERRFAEQLDARDDIRLFVKLPRWFVVETPIGSYNPDWAIVKDDRTVMYLVRETKSTKNFLKLRTSEADKVRCGQRHFEALGVSFDVVTLAEEV